MAAAERRGGLPGLPAVLDALDLAVALVDGTGDVQLANAAWRSSPLAGGNASQAVEALLAAIASVRGGAADRLVVHTLGADAVAYTTQVARIDGEASLVLVAAQDAADRAPSPAGRLPAIHDRLTALPTRDLLVDRLAHALERAAAAGTSVGILLADLDHFASVNERFGRDVGDDVLRLVADRLVATFGPGVTVARIGSDQFVVVAEELPSEHEALRARVLIDDALAASFRVGERDLRLTASVGISLTEPSDDGRTAQDVADELLRDADRALASAKRRGRNSTEVANPALRVELLDQLELEHDLRFAVERGELDLDYQPEVDLDSGEVLGAEALVRWVHPARGRLAPSRFVPDAERSGLIVPIGKWVLDAACRQAAQWPVVAGAAPMLVSVNLSLRQLVDRSFVDQVRAALDASGLPPEQLCLEVTESVAIEHLEDVRERLAALRSLGVLLALDDFGVGFSSLGHLHELPVDLVKVDRSFIARLARDDKAVAIVELIVGLGRRLGLRVVAEGVETGEQVAHLRRLGFSWGQGYRLGRPSTSAAVIDLAMVAARRRDQRGPGGDDVA